MLTHVIFECNGVFAITSSYYKRILISKDSFTGNTLSETSNLRQVNIVIPLKSIVQQNLLFFADTEKVVMRYGILGRGLNAVGYAHQILNVVRFTLTEKHVVYLKLPTSF